MHPDNDPFASAFALRRDPVGSESAPQASAGAPEPALPSAFEFTGGKAGADQRRVLGDPELVRWLRALQSELAVALECERIELAFDRDSAESVLELRLHCELDLDAAERALGAFLAGWLRFNHPPAWLDDIAATIAD